MTVSITSDTFTRANTTASTTISTGWGTASSGDSWNEITGSETFQIVSNEGAITNASSGSVLYLSSKTAADAEILYRFSHSASATESGGILRGDGTGANLYRTRQKAGTFYIWKVVSNSGSQITSTAFALTNGSFYWVRFRVVGTNPTNLYAKIWADGSGEPAAWTLTGTDSSTGLQTANRVGLFASPTATAQVINFDSLTINQAYNLTEQTESKFSIQMPLNTRARANFLVQIKGLTSNTRARFFTAMALKAQAQAKFFTQFKSLLTGTRAKFTTRVGLVGKSRATFSIRLPLSSAAHSRFLNRVGLLAPSRARFLIQTLTPKIFRASFSFKSLLNSSFSTLSTLSASFSELIMAQPYTTIQSIAKYTDSSGAALTGLSAVSVTVTFPDQSTSTYALNSGVTNNGDGTYTLQYNTKMVGLTREVWSATNTNGNVNQSLNIVPVSE